MLGRQQSLVASTGQQHIDPPQEPSTGAQHVGGAAAAHPSAQGASVDAPHAPALPNALMLNIFQRLHDESRHLVMYTKSTYAHIC